MECFRFFKSTVPFALALTFTLVSTGSVVAAENKTNIKKASSAPKEKSISDLMSDIKDRIKDKNFHWDMSLFSDQGWQEHGRSVNGQPLIYWTCGKPNHQNASLILSAVHGDEVTPVYYGFRVVEYLKARPKLCDEGFVVVAPIVNPDGFLRYRNGTRSNYNKVDLNRNFATPDWPLHALRLWKEKYGSQRRYFPGDKAGSEPETEFQEWLIDTFKPVKILSVHAPLNILDYDGPATKEALKLSETYIKSLENLQDSVKKATPALRYQAYGLFPGSLGNYAGKQRGIPTITAELPSTDAHLAAHYFGLIEKGTEVFIKQRVTDSPIRSAAAYND